MNTMLTISDIKKLTQIFVTKQDLEVLKEEVASKEDFRKVFNLLESTYGEIKNIRQEQTFHQVVHEDMKAKLQNIETKSIIRH